MNNERMREKVRLILLSCPDFKQKCLNIIWESGNLEVEDIDLSSISGAELHEFVRDILGEDRDAYFDARASLNMDIERYPISNGMYRTLFFLSDENRWKRSDFGSLERALACARKNTERKSHCYVGNGEDAYFFWRVRSAGAR